MGNMEQNTRRMPQEASTFHQASIGSEPASHLTPATADNLVNEVTVRLPTFMGNMPDIWFQQIESIFKNRRITSDTRKYELVFEALTPDIMEKISDFLRRPPEVDKYSAIKRLLLQRLTDSKQKQILRFLHELQLGDKQPSQFLREMRNLVGDLVHEDFLRTRFLQSMAMNIRTHLVGCIETTLDKLAEMADAILESCGGAYAMAVSHRNTSPEARRQQVTEPRLGALDEQVKEILVKLNALGEDRRRGHTGDVSHGGYGGERRSRDRTVRHEQRPRSRTHSGDKGICYYHRRFGIDAQHCLRPCSFSQMDGKQEN
ncbi:PREDICTED: uncharacterized protein LOC106792103 [Polistes canadensis]|uniref:uncharacterized protein LOC106792103 n=1 Tax=Polistes canadensis TaxID=91411 RepID=UPI000718E186|nr:PREDICTED: uncharacterized protein LOC106792103 [Polistes canadensis]